VCTVHFPVCFSNQSKKSNTQPGKPWFTLESVVIPAAGVIHQTKGSKLKLQSQVHKGEHTHVPVQTQTLLWTQNLICI